MVVLLLSTMTSLKQLYTLTMDCHSRFRTEAHKTVVPRFNERFILSLTNCKNTIILDDELNVLPINKSIEEVKIESLGLREGETTGDLFITKE